MSSFRASENMSMIKTETWQAKCNWRLRLFQQAVGQGGGGYLVWLLTRLLNVAGPMILPLVHITFYSIPVAVSNPPKNSFGSRGRSASLVDRSSPHMPRLLLFVRDWSVQQLLHQASFSPPCSASSAAFGSPP